MTEYLEVVAVYCLVFFVWFCVGRLSWQKGFMRNK